MGVWASVITGILGTAVKLIGSSQSPNYPSTPKIANIPVAQTRKDMQKYERARMGASIDAWKAKFPLLYAGGKNLIDTIGLNQQGRYSPTLQKSLKGMGLDPLKEGGGEFGGGGGGVRDWDAYSQSVDIGLSPITLAQRNSQAVNRQIAMNPEWSSRISGGTLATMLANNYQNQQAFTQFLGAQNTASFVNQTRQSMYNTAALTSGLLGATQAGFQAYANQQANANNPLTQPLNPRSWSDVSTPGHYMVPQQQQPSTDYQSSMWNSPPPTSYMYSNTWSGQFTPTYPGAINTPPPPPPQAYNPFTDPYLI